MQKQIAYGMVSQIKVWHGMYCKNQHIISHVGDKIEVLVWSVLQKLLNSRFRIESIAETNCDWNGEPNQGLCMECIAKTNT